MKPSGPIVRNTPMRRMSPRRAQEMRTYARERRLHLKAHPYCQVWLREHGISESVAIAQGGWVFITFLGQPGQPPHCVAEVKAPRSTQIHHTNKRRGAMLLDKAYWLAVCRRSHERIERDKAWARANGYLLNF